MRKALRRLKRSVEEQSAVASGAAAGGAGSSLGAIAAALGGAAPASSSAASSSAAAAAIAVPSGPARTKKLRYTFNSKLRDDRIKADLEDLTDDEDDVRLGRIDKLAAAAGGGSSAGMAADAGAGGDDDDEDGVLEFRAGADGSIVVEEAGLKKPAGREKPKRGNFFADAPAAGARPGSVGFYESDPALSNPRRARSHRKGQLRAKIEAAAFGKPK